MHFLFEKHFLRKNFEEKNCDAGEFYADSFQTRKQRRVLASFVNKNAQNANYLLLMTNNAVFQ